MPSAGSVDMERSTEPVVYDRRAPSEKPAGDGISLDTQQRDALFKEFVEYQKREAHGDNLSPKEALFAEFQMYVKRLLEQPDRQLTGASASPSAVP